MCMKKCDVGITGVTNERCLLCPKEVEWKLSKI